MPEQMFRELAERIEERVELPDLAVLEARGRNLRRRRTTVGVAVAAVLLGGAALASVSAQDGSVPPVDEPVVDPGRTLDPTPPEPSPLQDGRQYSLRVSRPGGATEVLATLTPTADGWTWFGDTAAQAGPGGEMGDVPRVPYAEVGVSTPTRVPRGQCRTEVPPWRDLADSPDRAARQVGEVPRVRVLDEPTPDDRFGHPGVRVRLSVPRVCAEWNDALLWGETPAIHGGQPGVGTVLLSGQVVDVWVVDVAGELVFVHLSRSPGLPQWLQDDAQDLLDSVTLAPAPEG